MYFLKTYNKACTYMIHGGPLLVDNNVFKKVIIWKRGEWWWWSDKSFDDGFRMKITIQEMG